MDMKQLDALFSSLTRGCNDEIYSEFIRVMFEFVDKLILVFRKYDAQLRQARNTIGAAVGNANAREVVESFMVVAAPVKHLVAEQNPDALVILAELPAFQGMDIQSDYNKLTPRTQQALWSYLGKLIVLGDRCQRLATVAGPLQDPQFREKLLRTTMECEKEFADDGKEVSSMEDIMKLARTVNERMK